mgnify:CR=1 FL=1
MIVPGPTTRMFLAPGGTDLRRSFDGLHGLVRCQLAEDLGAAGSVSGPRSGRAGHPAGGERDAPRGAGSQELGLHLGDEQAE